MITSSRRKIAVLDDSTVRQLLAFRSAREWEQFHTPLALSIALSVEAGELLQHFQWRSGTDTGVDEDQRDSVSLEVADLAILLTYLANDLGIDLDEAVQRKLALNEERYPVNKARGRATKYDQL